MAVTPFDRPHSRKSYAARTPQSSVCFRCGVIGDEMFTSRGSGFVLARRFMLRDYRMVVDLFCSCDLDLDPMTFIYELDPYSLKIHGMCKYELTMSRLRQLSSDSQTDRIDRIYHPRRFADGELEKVATARHCNWN